MIRLFGIAILVLCTATPGLYADDEPDQAQPEPPVRLKKKTKEKDEPKRDDKEPKNKLKDKAEKDGGEPTAAEPEKDAKEIVARIAKNMKESKDRLGHKDAGDGTRQIHRDIIKDIDSLIDQKKRQQQQQQHQQNSQRSSSRQRGSQAEQGNQRRQRQQQAAAKQQSKPQQASANNPGGGGNRKKEGMGRDADLFKDIWGHLPEKLRKDMDAYSRVEFMMKYSDLLKQYYSTIAEKGRRKGE